MNSHLCWEQKKTPTQQSKAPRFLQPIYVCNKSVQILEYFKLFWIPNKHNQYLVHLKLGMPTLLTIWLLTENYFASNKDGCEREGKGWKISAS